MAKSTDELMEILKSEPDIEHFIEEKLDIFLYIKEINIFVFGHNFHPDENYSIA